MKSKITTIFACLALLILTINSAGAQNLPAQMSFSDDGKRLVTGGVPLSGFYDEAVINTVELFFDEPNYWTLLTNNYQSGTDLGAMAVINGDTLASKVGVRFKGATSYFMNQTQKKSFNITIDFEDEDQDYQGYTTLNLNNAFADASFMREMVFYHLCRKHIPVANANYSMLYINGQSWGLYPNVQQLNGAYFKEWFLSNDGTSWRAVKPGGSQGPGGPGGNPFGTGVSSLNWLGTSVAEYEANYTLKRTSKENPWEDLIHTCDVLNNTPLADLEAALKNVMDVDRTLWYLAHEIIFCDDDSYVWKGGMDYYLYWEPETGRMVPLEYDANSSFRLNFATQWNIFYNQNDARFVLMNRLFAVPALRQRYLAHVRTIIQQSLDQTTFDELVEGYFNLIDAEVEADPKKIYTYNQFLSEKEVLKQFVAQRRNYLLNLPGVNVAGPSISNAAFSAGGVAFVSPDADQPVAVTATISATAGLETVNLYYGTGLVGAFEKTTMHDDGAHGDGAAGDGVFGAEIPGHGNGTYVRFYMEAVAANTAKTVTYLPEGAEHDVFVYRVNVTSFSASDVVINELMADNKTTVTDKDGEYEDWIELYNNAATAIDLSGWYLTDKADNLTKWPFPDGTTIGGNGYLIVWADENGSEPGLHANFKLSKSGETIYLVAPDLSIAQEIVFTEQETDRGYARQPNGTGNFLIKDHTFNGNNDLPFVAVKETGSAVDFTILPNPADAYFLISSSEEKELSVEIFDLLGRLMASFPLYKNTKVETGEWAAGMYLVKVGGSVQRVVLR